MARSRRPRRELTPADVTQRMPPFGGGRPQAWQARSRDGIWRYDRLEISGTPWLVVHLPTSTEGSWHGTLSAARQATADGSALEYVERLLAHGRGEHADERDPYCGRC
jgi:hypothetical protein